MIAVKFDLFNSPLIISNNYHRVSYQYTYTSTPPQPPRRSVALTSPLPPSSWCGRRRRNDLHCVAHRLLRDNNSKQLWRETFPTTHNSPHSPSFFSFPPLLFLLLPNMMDITGNNSTIVIICSWTRSERRGGGTAKDKIAQNVAKVAGEEE